MKSNIGNLDRGLRIGGGLLLLVLTLTESLGPWGWVGVVPLATGFAGWCPVYSLLGIRTCKTT